MARCTDRPRLHIKGCGAEYNGEMQHCLAKAPWSQFEDGVAHVTGRVSTIEAMWEAGPGTYPADPTTIEGLKLNEYGYWVREMRPEAREWAAKKGEERSRAKAATPTRET